MDKAASRIRLRNNCNKTRNPLKSVPYGNFLADSFFILDLFITEVSQVKIHKRDLT